MRRRLAAVLACGALVGCATIFGIPSDVERSDRADASTPFDAVAPEAAPPAEPTNSDVFIPPVGDCDLAAELGPPVPVPGLEPEAPTGLARLSEDERTIVFSAGSPPFPTQELFIATRESTAAAFGKPTRITASAPGEDDLAPNLSADLRSVLFARGKQGFFQALRAATTEPDFGTAIPIATAAGSGAQDPFQRAGETDIWFAAPSGADFDLFVAFAGPDGPALKAAPGVNASGTSEIAPVISKDGLTLYFASDRLSPDEDGELFQVWRATRGSKNDDFALPRQIPGLLAKEASVLPGWLSSDGCRLYMTRTTATSQRAEILVASRPPKGP